MDLNLTKAIILGFVQGLTEFLPVSSSGHLVLFGEMMGVKDPDTSFIIALHFGTLLSVLIYFRMKLWLLCKGLFQPRFNEAHRTALLICVATVPAVILGLGFKDFFEQSFSNEVLAATMLLVTGVLLLLPSLAQSLRKNRPDQEINLFHAIIMGLGQALAILPGISRSGATIASGMLAGANPSRAAEFSFLMAIPIIAGGAVFEFRDLERFPREMLTQCLVGTVIAFISGLFAIYAVLDSIRRGKFQYFAIYCFAVGILALVLFQIRS